VPGTVEDGAVSLLLSALLTALIFAPLLWLAD
jgi:hypothetical protein